MTSWRGIALRGGLFARMRDKTRVTKTEVPEPDYVAALDVLQQWLRQYERGGLATAERKDRPMSEPDTAEIRVRHQPRDAAGCQSCWAPYPCDAIRLCDALDEVTRGDDGLTDSERAESAARWLQGAGAPGTKAESARLKGIVAQQAAEIERLLVITREVEQYKKALADIMNRYMMDTNTRSFIFSEEAKP